MAPKVTEGVKFRGWGKEDCSLRACRGGGWGYWWFHDWDVQTYCSGVCSCLTLWPAWKRSLAWPRIVPGSASWKFSNEVDFSWAKTYFSSLTFHRNLLVSDKTLRGITGNELGLLPWKPVHCSRAGASGVPSVVLTPLRAPAVARWLPLFWLLWSFQDLEVQL